MHSQPRKFGIETAEFVAWPAPCAPPQAPAATEAGSLPRAVARLMGPLARDSAARRVLAEVGRDFEVAQEQLLDKGRCTAAIALARQVAMYLLHVELGRQLSEVGRMLGRDRTTVSHACAHVEDLREDGAFDARIDAIEHAIRADATPAPAPAEVDHVARA